MTVPESDAAAVAESRALRDFVGRVGGARVRASVLRFAVQWIAPAAAVLAVLAWVSPALARWIVPATGLALASVLLAIVWRERRAVRESLLLLHSRGIAIADLVLAWEEAEQPGRSTSPMGAWLRADLAAAIASLPERREFEWLAPRLGPLRYAVPIAVALCVFLWLLPDLDLPTPGVSDPPPPPPPRELPSGGTGNGSQRPSAGGGTPDDTRQDPGGKQPDDAPKQPEPAPGESQPPEAPAPFLDLPTKTEVLVPELVRDGPTRRAMAHRALVGTEEDGGAAAPVARTGLADGDGQALPQPTHEDFERAEERASRDRRVTARERAIVRRFFALLTETGR